MDIVFNDGAVFVSTVVVGGDTARTVVDTLAHGGVAQVGEVVGFGAFGQGGVFHFHEVADMHFIAQFSAWAQAGKWTNESTLANANARFFTVNMGEGVDDGVVAYSAVGQHAVGAYAHVVAQHYLAFKHAVDINIHILAALQLAAHVDTGRVAQAYTSGH